jgi:hypothetical protein
MLTWIIRNRIRAFEKAYNYDMSYARLVLQADTSAMLALSTVTALSGYRKDVPREVYYAAKLESTLAQDCGPCAQLVITMALREGVAATTLAAITEAIRSGNDQVLAADVALGLRFSQAVRAHAPAADAMRETIVNKWGPRGLVSLAFAITAAQVYPTLKYALGHGHACQRLDIAGTFVVPPTAAHVAALSDAA